MPQVGDINDLEVALLHQLSQGVFTEPACMVRVDAWCSTYPVDEVGEGERVRRCKKQEPPGTQVVSGRIEQSPKIDKVLDDLAGEDNIKLLVESHRLRVAVDQVEAVSACCCNDLSVHLSVALVNVCILVWCWWSHELFQLNRSEFGARQFVRSAASMVLMASCAD